MRNIKERNSTRPDNHVCDGAFNGNAAAGTRRGKPCVPSRKGIRPFIKPTSQGAGRAGV